MRVAASFVCAVLALAACARISEPRSPEFDQAVVAVAAEVNRHCARLDEAQDMGEVRAEISRHDAAMAAAIDGLRLRAAGCGHRMLSTTDGLSLELAEHDTRLANATDIGTVRAEGDRYAAAVSDLLERMFDRWDELRCS